MIPARYLWQLIEPYHAVVYFDRDATARFEEAGFKGGWMAYFAGRAGPLGPVGAEVVTALFFNFHPSMVARSLPDAWSFSTPQAAIETRVALADGALRRILGDRIAEDGISNASQVAVEAARAGEVAGRPLFAANAGQPVPDDPHLALWWACTALREHRGDGHVACLTQAGLDGCEANVLAAAAGTLKAETQQSFRGWSAQEWTDATERLRARGWLDGDGLSADGRNAKQHIEQATDRLASSPFEALGQARVERLIELLEPLTTAIIESGAVRYPNPMGLTAPDRSR